MYRNCKLPHDVVTYWRKYGTLSSCLSRICQEEEIINLPKTFDTTECTTNVPIELTDDLESLAQTLGKSFSPTRILCYYYLSKLPEQNEWQPVNSYVDFSIQTEVKSIEFRVKKFLQKYPQYSDLLQQICRLLEELEQCISQSTTLSRD